MIHTTLLLALLLLQGVIPAQERQILTLATTTSTENSGLLAALHPDLEARTGIVVKVIARGTGASLQLARDGNADVILVHARAQEDQFTREGYGIHRRDVMYNDFVILGPADDPAGIKGLTDAGKALQRIATSEQTFISRGDSSGTHYKEQELWGATGLTLEEKTRTIQKKGMPVQVSMVAPTGDWYRSIGQGMGRTIGVATELQAYALADRGTFYAYALGEQPRTDLVIMCEGDARLFNPYGVIAVNPIRHPHVRYDLAILYIRWLTSPETQEKIGSFTAQGKVLFHPSAADQFAGSRGTGPDELVVCAGDQEELALLGDLAGAFIETGNPMVTVRLLAASDRDPLALLQARTTEVAIARDPENEERASQEGWASQRTLLGGRGPAPADGSDASVTLSHALCIPEESSPLAPRARAFVAFLASERGQEVVRDHPLQGGDGATWLDARQARRTQH